MRAIKLTQCLQHLSPTSLQQNYIHIDYSKVWIQLVKIASNMKFRHSAFTSDASQVVSWDMRKYIFINVIYFIVLAMQTIQKELSAGITKL